MENLENLFDAIRADYLAWSERAKMMPEMVTRFNEGLSYTVGQKYIKIISDGAVWGFVINCHNDKQFKYGDILKAAGWNAPARNKSRGNVLDKDFSMVRWTGPEYLK